VMAEWAVQGGSIAAAGCAINDILHRLKGAGQNEMFPTVATGIATEIAVMPGAPCRGINRS